MFLTGYTPVLHIRTGQQSITTNFQPLTAHIYQVMIIVTSGFSKKSFFFYSYNFYSLEILLNNLELVFLEFKQIYKTQRSSLFSFYLLIFYLLYCNHSVYYPPFCAFALLVNTQDEPVLFLIVVLQSFYVIRLSTICTWTGSLKRTLFLISFLNEASIFLRWDLPQLKLESQNC